MVEGRAVVMFRNDMIRELQLIELGQSLDDVGPSGLDPVAKVLRSDLEWLRDEFVGHFRSVDEGVAVDGMASSDALTDFVADLRPDAAVRIKSVVDRFEELNWFSSHGLLLTLEASPVVMDLIRWLRDEAFGQLVEGRPPRPFVRAAD